MSYQYEKCCREAYQIYKKYVGKSVDKVHRRHLSALYRQKQHRVHISFALERQKL
jgi:hypothetical protein